jgi:ABC-type nitrate/sulfonate/bicarbonate transport system substrate-binding protein
MFWPLIKIPAVALLAVSMLHAPESRSADPGEIESTVPIRIGWQIPAATQGQVLQVLKRTNVLEGHGLKPVFVPFSYGGPQVDAAFAGELDVFFAGDQPAINLIARGG